MDNKRAINWKYTGLMSDNGWRQDASAGECINIKQAKNTMLETRSKSRKQTTVKRQTETSTIARNEGREATHQCYS